MADARNLDLLGEGADLDYSSNIAPAGMDQAEYNRRRKQWLANQGLDENGNQLPAYGTSAADGGTAKQYGVTAAGTGVGGGSFDAYSGKQTSGPRQQYTVDYAGRPGGGRDIPTLEDIAAPIDDAANERARDTQDLVNRYSAIQMDTGPADQAREQQQQALGMQQAIYDKLLSYNPQAEANAASKRAMSRQLAIARSAPGGAASRQAAQFQALQSAPAIQAEAAETANAQAQRNTQLAAQAAAGFAQTAAGTRSQDIQQAQNEVDTGLSVANGIAQAVGRDIELSSQEARFLGQAQLALEGIDVDWAQLDEQQRSSMADEAFRKAGLEQQWKMFKEEQKVDALDVIGALTGTARSAVGTYATGKQAGIF